MRIDLFEIEQQTSVLAGALAGRALLGRLLTLSANDSAMPEPCLLDFGRVEVATASFLRESVLAFRDLVRGRRSNLYPVVANPTHATCDELEEILRTRGEAMMICRVDQRGSISAPALVGTLDPKQQLTFDLLHRYGEADAGTLMKLSAGHDDVGQTAWNNRLAYLASKGLILEISQGRTKRYRPLFKEAA